MAGAEWDTLTIEERADGDRAVVAPVGDLDIANVQRLYEAFGRRADGQGLLLDLRGLGFLDTSGLQAVVDAYRDATEHGFELVIVRGAEHITRVFEIAGLDDRLPFVDSPEPQGAAG